MKVKFQTKVRKWKYRKGEREYYSYYIRIPSRYIKDGMIDPDRPVVVEIENIAGGGGDG